MNAREATLRTRRLLLQPMTASDATVVHCIWTTPGVRRFLFDGEVLTWAKTTAMLELSMDLFCREGTGLWLGRGNDGEAIAFCGYWYFHQPPQLELVYGVAEEYWGNGYATEAARALAEYGQRRLGLRTIRASTDAANAPSLWVMDKLGMRLARAGPKGKQIVCAVLAPSCDSFHAKGRRPDSVPLTQFRSATVALDAASGRRRTVCRWHGARVHAARTVAKR
ncbi:MAG: GNAT family N-acetyltransferase [Candidatus Binatia bacterium]|nr:GNAT family N-acetyltransferase [Candidatus Binatia bacterium]